jgi:hypothetical protein
MTTTAHRQEGPPMNTLSRLGADWIAVIVAGLLVLLAGLGLLPTIPFLIK